MPLPAILLRRRNESEIGLQGVLAVAAQEVKAQLETNKQEVKALRGVKAAKEVKAARSHRKARGINLPKGLYQPSTHRMARAIEETQAPTDCCLSYGRLDGINRSNSTLANAENAGYDCVSCDGYESYDTNLRSLHFTAVGLPPGLIINPDSAKVVGQPRLFGLFEVSIFAIQLASGNTFPVSKFSLAVLQCGDQTEEDSGNQDSPTCLNGGVCQYDAGIAKHEANYTCGCFDAYQGAKCEQNKMGTKGTNQDVILAVVVGASGFVLITVMLTALYLRYSAFVPPYAQGCDPSRTYSTVIVHDRSQPWAYGYFLFSYHFPVCMRWFPLSGDLFHTNTVIHWKCRPN